MMSKYGEIRRDDTCLDYSGETQNVVIVDCHGMQGNQKWVHTNVSNLSPVITQSLE